MPQELLARLFEVPAASGAYSINEKPRQPRIAGFFEVDAGVVEVLSLRVTRVR
jgi:hypothetical protein